MTARLNRVAERINIEAQRMNPDQSGSLRVRRRLPRRACVHGKE
jgi:hypothetical protein